MSLFHHRTLPESGFLWPPITKVLKADVKYKWQRHVELVGLWELLYEKHTLKGYLHSLPTVLVKSFMFADVPVFEL